jgi:CheY-like chemotaxis protein
MAATATTLSLPYDEDDAAEPDFDEAGPPNVDERARPRVLLVEDDREMRRLLTDVLQKHGYQIVEATSGAEAVELVLQPYGCGGALELPFDLIITDVRMSGYSGLELLELLRTTTITTPAIVITAFGAAEVHASATQLGAVAVFDKPFDVDSLARTVRELIDS